MIQGLGVLCQLGIHGQGSPVVGVLWAFLAGERALQPDRHSDKEGGCAALPAMLWAKYSGYHSIILDVRGPENGTISLTGAGLATTSEIRQHAQAVGGGGPHFRNPFCIITTCVCKGTRAGGLTQPHNANCWVAVREMLRSMWRTHCAVTSARAGEGGLNGSARCCRVGAADVKQA